MVFLPQMSRIATSSSSNCIIVMATLSTDLPHVSGAATGLRLTSLLDRIGRSQYEPLRELMLKMLAYSIWREHPDAITIRAVFGYVDVPSAVELNEGKKESYNFLYAYDFSFPSQSTDSQKR